MFVGTSILHANRKAVLTRHLLDQLGWSQVPVVTGTGGPSDTYQEFNSSAPARKYQGEGYGILDDQVLEALEAQPRSSTALQHQIKAALRSQSNVEFLVLTAPTDLMAVLNKNPKLAKKIRHLHVMGGWRARRMTTGRSRTGRPITG